jgi:hypothetical protein
MCAQLSDPDLARLIDDLDDIRATLDVAEQQDDHRWADAFIVSARHDLDQVLARLRPRGNFGCRRLYRVLHEEEKQAWACNDGVWNDRSLAATSHVLGGKDIEDWDADELHALLGQEMFRLAAAYLKQLGFPEALVDVVDWDVFRGAAVVLSAKHGPPTDVAIVSSP